VLALCLPPREIRPDWLKPFGFSPKFDIAYLYSDEYTFESEVLVLHIWAQVPRGAVGNQPFDPTSDHLRSHGMQILQNHLQSCATEKQETKVLIMSVHKIADMSRKEAHIHADQDHITPVLIPAIFASMVSLPYLS
jgi:hypothetical protein